MFPSKGKSITFPTSGFAIWLVRATAVTSPNAVFGNSLRRRQCWQGKITINTCVRSWLKVIWSAGKGVANWTARLCFNLEPKCFPLWLKKKRWFFVSMDWAPSFLCSYILAEPHVSGGYRGDAHSCCSDAQGWWRGSDLLAPCVQCGAGRR